MNAPPTPSWGGIAIALIPSALVLVVMARWSLRATEALLANVRMLLQLVAVGYVLKAVFETERPWVVGLVLAVMLGAAAWIALRPLARRSRGLLGVALLSLGVAGLFQLALITQIVLDAPRYFEPRLVVPLAGMIFANSMNTVSLAAERLEAELLRGVEYERAKRVALQAALIPQINALLAVGLVSLPGMMTGQILSGVDPMVAVRYQIVVMGMTFGAAGLASALFLTLARRHMPAG